MIKDKEKLIADGYLKEIKHPSEDLYLYNYTSAAQLAGLNDPIWQTDLKHCRGLILNKDGEVVARPFPKFWNLEQYEHNGLPPYNFFEVYDKLDGSLGILYPTKEGLAIATRGSFESEQAKWATDFLNKRYQNFVDEIMFFKENSTVPFPDFTFLFEIIYPENRIVVNYGEEKLVLLGGYYNDGEELTRESLEYNSKKYGFPIVEKFDGINDFTKVRELVKRDNAEGFVIRFDTGFRVKLKYEEYCRLHRIVTGISSKSIWEMLRHGDSFEEVLNMVPDEFYKFVLDTKRDLEKQFQEILSEATTIYLAVGNLHTRKEQAIEILKHSKKLASIVFALLDNKDYQDIIWKMLEPSFKQPFKTGIEES